MASLNPQLIGIDAYNRAELSNYPLVDDASLRDTTDQFSIPQDLLVDMMLPVPLPETYNAALFHISEVGVHGDWIIIRVGYNGTDVAKASVPINSHDLYDSYYLSGTSSDFFGIAGRITVGRLDNTIRQAGVFRFNVNNAAVRPTLTVPMMIGVRSITPVNQGESDEAVQGNVFLSAGTNVKINQSGNSFIIDAIDGEGLTDQCECTNVRELPPPIRRIEGIAPTSDGDFFIQGSECISVSGILQGLSLGDECATPCCGSEELETLQTDQNNLNEDVRTLNNILQQLNTRLTEVEQVKAMIEASGLVSFS